MSLASRTAAVIALLLPAATAHAQTFHRGGTDFAAMRPVSLVSGKSPSVVVTEFFHHGEIAPDGRNVAVCARNGEFVPVRVLQLGPGDYCRLAFQTARAQTAYEIFYGGERPTARLPEWTCRDGLLLEIRQYKECNLQSLESVRAAFDSAPRIGADYVEGVHHSHNPISLRQEKFLSRYSGYLQITSPGTYGFFTSSRDCSFLLIDGKVAVAAPGRHGPEHRARPGSRQDVQLSAGTHKFEYYHACADSGPVMAVAWEIEPRGDKGQPTQIPPEAFVTQAVGRATAGRVTLRSGKHMPDFAVKIACDVPLPDNDMPLLGVLFRDNSAQALTMSAKILWDFGDGQTSEKPNVDHVYLHPGLYTVTLNVKRAGGKPLEMTNRVEIERPALTAKDKLHTLDDYLPILNAYDRHSLDAVALRQLVLAYEAKALALEAQAEDARKKAAEGENRPDSPAGTAQLEPPAAVKYLTAAVEAGKVAFVGQSAAKGDEDLLKLAQVVGPLARDRLGQSELAFQIWQGAMRRIATKELRAPCAIEAADIAINDMAKPAVAKPLLEAAASQFGKDKTDPAAANFQRIWGDYHAATGNGQEASKAYRQAERLAGSAANYAAQTARRGAHSRSTEEFLREGRLDRASEEIRAWQREFPAEKIDGYLTLLYARYWAARGQHAAAIAQAEQLQALNPTSPYMDQVLWLAADCEVKRSRVDRALATLQSLLKDYPGSPLVPKVKKTIARLGGK